MDARCDHAENEPVCYGTFRLGTPRADQVLSPVRHHIMTWIRAKIVLVASQGLSNDVIASRLDSPRQIVSKWR
jgi:hypothetical protein